MENICQRFPHISKSIFDNMGDLSLVNCKEASRELSNHLDMERFFWIRIIRKYSRNFEEFKESWKTITYKTPKVIVEKLAKAAHNFFAKYSPCISVKLQRVKKNSDNLTLSADFFAKGSHIMAGVSSVCLEF